MKNFIALLIFLGLCAAVGWTWYSKKTTAWIAEVSQQTEVLEQRIATQKAELAAINQALETRKLANATHQALTIVQAQQRQADEQKAALTKLQQEAEKVNREKLVGVVLNDVTLADGRRLSQARVTKVDDSSVSFSTPSGVLRVTSRELTPELQEYFRLSP